MNQTEKNNFKTLLAEGKEVHHKSKGFHHSVCVCVYTGDLGLEQADWKTA